MPRVSVCMAAYNHERYIGSAIQSVLDQTYKDWELIITDDASTDHTPEVISRFTDPRIKFFRSETNQGIAATTAKCAREAQGEYIAILNSDDLFLPSKLEKQVQLLNERPEVAAVFSHTWFINRWGKDYNKLNIGFYANSRNIFNKANRSRWEWLNYFFYHGNTLCDPSVMARREVYTEIAPPDPRFPIAGDYNRWVRVCLRHEIFIIPEVLLHFRIHGKNASGNWLGPRPRISWELLLILRNYLELTEPDELRRVFPELFRDLDPDPELIPYYLALAALKARSHTHRLFAVEVLSTLLGDRDKARRLQEKHGFGYRDFWRLCKLI
ncbi:MAG: glycosyltransferase [Bacillota bacterium]|nr:glycosyltransferase [Bacillota bacterium]